MAIVRRPIWLLMAFFLALIGIFILYGTFQNMETASWYLGAGIGFALLGGSLLSAWMSNRRYKVVSTTRGRGRTIFVAFILGLIIVPIAFGLISLVNYNAQAGVIGSLNILTEEEAYQRGLVSSLTGFTVQGQDSLILKEYTKASVGSTVNVDGIAAGVTVSRSGAYLSDEYGRYDPDQTGEYVGSGYDPDTNTFIQYKKYHYCVSVTARTNSYVDITPKAKKLGFLIDMRKDVWGGPWASTFSKPWQTDRFNIVFWGADVTKRVGGVSLQYSLEFQATFSMSAFGDYYVDSSGTEYTLLDAWSGIKSCYIGKVDAGFVGRSTTSPDVPLETLVGDPERDVAKDPEVDRDTYAKWWYNSKEISQRVSDPSPQVTETKESSQVYQPDKPFKVSLGSEGQALEGDSVILGDQSLEVDNLGQSWTVYSGMTLQPRYYDVLRGMTYSTTLWHFQAAWYSTWSTSKQTVYLDPEIVGGEAIDVWGKQYIIFDVITGTKYDINPPGKDDTYRDVSVPEDFADEPADKYLPNLEPDQEEIEDWRGEPGNFLDDLNNFFRGVGTAIGNLFGGFFEGLLSGDVGSWIILILIIVAVIAVSIFVIPRVMPKKKRAPQRA